MAKTTAVKSDKNELIRRTITACGYLVRWGSRLTLSKFAAAIRRHLTDRHTEAVAATLESATGLVARGWYDLHMN